MASFRNAGAALGAYAVVGGRPELSADLLRQLDDDPLRTADVAEPIAVFVLLHLANQRRAAGSQASDDGVDVVDCEYVVRVLRAFGFAGLVSLCGARKVTPLFSQEGGRIDKTLTMRSDRQLVATGGNGFWLVSVVFR